MIGKVSLDIAEETCDGCATIAQYQRVIADRDEQARQAIQANPKAGPGAKLPSDGLHVHLRVLSPAEAAAKAQKARSKAKGAADG